MLTTLRVASHAPAALAAAIAARPRARATVAGSSGRESADAPHFAAAEPPRGPEGDRDKIHEAAPNPAARDAAPVSPYDTPPSDPGNPEPTAPAFPVDKPLGDSSSMADTADLPSDERGGEGGEGAAFGEGAAPAGGAGGGGGGGERPAVGSGGVKVDNPQDVPFRGS